MLSGKIWGLGKNTLEQTLSHRFSCQLFHKGLWKRDISVILEVWCYLESYSQAEHAIQGRIQISSLVLKYIRKGQMVIHAALIIDVEENVIYSLIKITPKAVNSKEWRRQIGIFSTNKIVMFPLLPTPPLAFWKTQYLPNTWLVNQQNVNSQCNAVAKRVNA